MVVLLFLLAGSAFGLSAQTKAESINTGYFITFGRYPSDGEFKYWNGQPQQSISQYVENHKQYLSGNIDEKKGTIQRAFMDAFGWGPSSQELTSWSQQNKTYVELLNYNINTWLRPYPDKKATVIKQSYYKVFNRLPSEQELKYWAGQPQTYSFVQLVAFHTSWKIRNNQQSSGIGLIMPNLNANNISTSALSPQAAASVVAAGGLNLIAPGGGNVVAAGGLNLVSPRGN